MFLVALFCACSKDDKDDVILPSKDKSSTPLLDEIYKETGCKPIDYESIHEMHLFVDSLSNNRYLYGAKYKNENNIFWIAKFTPQGAQEWEIVNSNSNYYSRAFNPHMLSSGGIVIANVLYDRTNMINVIDVSPVVINNGQPIYVKVYDGYVYTDVYAFDKFFFCGINDKELVLNSKAKKYFVQIDNNGNILAKNGEMNIPKNYAIWKDNNTFISIDPSMIYKQDISPLSDIKWKYAPILPTFSTCTINAKFDKDTVIVNYKLKTAGNEEKDIIYKLSYETGILFDDTAVCDYLDFKKPYIASDSLTVTVDTINVEDKGLGTIYYTVHYLIENKTKSKTVDEGSFEAYNSNNTLGQTQYGFFSTLYPGESSQRSYTFKSLSKEPFSYIQYKIAPTNSGNTSKILRWKIRK
mgnify:CR=1 FL=1